MQKTDETGRVTISDLEHINAIIRKGDRVEIGPGPNGSIKIMQIKRKIVYSGR